MKKYLILGLALIFSVGLVLAGKPDFQAATITNPQTAEPKNTVALPPKAIEVAPNIYYLGQAVDKGRLVEGYAFIHKEKPAKPTGCNNDGTCQGWEESSCADCSGGSGGTGSSCYGFLAKGAKWKSIEPYIVNPANTRGLGDTFVVNNLAADIGKWETAADNANILGEGSSTTAILEADTSSTDDQNEVYFGNIAEPGAIAITIVWGYFGGPPWARELVEWDQVYDQVDFDWSANCLLNDCTTKMDFENIATHELGHSVGLDDLYTSECSEQTMYGYADNGETNKRSLESGDITGVKKLYS